MIGPDTVLRRADDVRYRLVHDEGVVVRQRSAEALVVSEVGARLLDLLDGQRSVAAILRLLEAEYDVAPETLALDVARYLAEIVEIGLVVPVQAEQRPTT